MKAKLTLIASALLLMSNIAGAQEQKAPSAGVQEQGAPSAKMTGQEAPSAGAEGQEAPSAGTQQKAPGKKMGEVMKNLGEGMRNLGQSMMIGQSMMGEGMHGSMYRIMFVLMDTDGDGTLSLEEFQTAHAKIFKAMDADKDGKVTFAEMQAFFHGSSPTSDQ
jgi:EF hand